MPLVRRVVNSSSLYRLLLTTLCPMTQPNRCLTGQKENSLENRLALINPKLSLMLSFIFDPNTWQRSLPEPKITTIKSMNFLTQFIDCGFLKPSLSMRSLSWLPLTQPDTLEKSTILQALATMTLMPVSRGASSVTPSFSSINSQIPLIAKLSKANMVSSPLCLTSFLHLGYPVTTLWRNCLFVSFDHADTILEEGVLSQSNFSCAHSHDQITCDSSPDEHLSLKNLISSHEPCCPSKVQLETLSKFHWCAQCEVPPVVFSTWDSYQLRFLSSQLGQCFVLLCFIVVISRTEITIEYPSVNLVLYSYTPNKELDSWQIVLAHLASFLEP